MDSQPLAVLSILANLLDVKYDGKDHSDGFEHDTQAALTKHADKIVSIL
jgi:hypothetical protein